MRIIVVFVILGSKLDANLQHLPRDLAVPPFLCGDIVDCLWGGSFVYVFHVSSLMPFTRVFVEAIIHFNNCLRWKSPNKPTLGSLSLLLPFSERGVGDSVPFMIFHLPNILKLPSLFHLKYVSV